MPDLLRERLHLLLPAGTVGAGVVFGGPQPAGAAGRGQLFLDLPHLLARGRPGLLVPRHLLHRPAAVQRLPRPLSVPAPSTSPGRPPSARATGAESPSGAARPAPTGQQDGPRLQFQPPVAVLLRAGRVGGGRPQVGLRTSRPAPRDGRGVRLPRGHGPPDRRLTLDRPDLVGRRHQRPPPPATRREPVRPVRRVRGHRRGRVLRGQHGRFARPGEREVVAEE